jgi:hypothetical protein
MMIESQARVLGGGICITEVDSQKKCAQHAFREQVNMGCQCDGRSIRNWRDEARRGGVSRQVKANQGYAECSAAVDRGKCHPLSCWIKDAP